jgi:hypothetical protein
VTDLSGTWLGSYWQNGEQVRFEFALIHSGNSLSGNILDDCYLGEANVSGVVLGRKVRFSKQYVFMNQFIVRYSGTVSDDGDFIKGDWFCTEKVLGFHSLDLGRWEAHRNIDNLNLEWNVITRLAGIRI